MSEVQSSALTPYLCVLWDQMTGTGTHGLGLSTLELGTRSCTVRTPTLM